jgi:serine/threonine-protein kinase
MIKLVDFGLVKVLAPDEVTITIIQGQGTALYTPLEQYGGADSHTDVRSDIFAFGATLYHLLTNQSPAEAKERFLDPNRLTAPRTINQGISLRTEKAILWAMELHPDHRPESIESFRQYLFGTKELPSRPQEIRSRTLTLKDALTSPPESILIWLTAGLMLVGLIATLGK